MPSRAAFVFFAIVLVAACNKKPETTTKDTTPATSAEHKADAITRAEGSVKAGANYGTFSVSSPTALKLAKGTTLTATPEGEIVAFSINDGAGGSIRCQRDSGCTGACTWETSPTDATCSGAAEASGGGQTCACSWHYQRPDGGTEQ